MPLGDYVALLLDAVEFDSDVDLDAEADTEPSCEVPHEEMSERQPRSARRPVDPDAPTFLEIGRYFAGEIDHSGAAALQSAARLGPRRVLALLG